MHVLKNLGKILLGLFMVCAPITCFAHANGVSMSDLAYVGAIVVGVAVGGLCGVCGITLAIDGFDDFFWRNTE